MKNVLTTFVSAMALSTSIVFAGHMEDKNKSGVKNLPPAEPVLETPAPKRTKTSNDYGKYTPAQKASIVALKVAK
ncbi:hypothetical protein [Dyadobacter sediminis]|uniref:Uncharacterized protein n=1 Tax=Dyadobacter sediminis TaxID=1493691 RepID=A0A5R9KDJ4_9BACT|nr:hypothetical protein [Dyadobacter sediminis]TLU94220.1 hypothetical protein FEM55_08155 [Dyadobacter sediminis]GGB93171.1 hypothetical protein GCM10011325_20750 [Dyadobacter sediminis]